MVCYSTSAGSTSDSKSSSIRASYIRITILECQNLQYYSEKTQELQPYIKVSAGKRSFKTSHKHAKGEATWNTTLEIPVREGNTLKVLLMDHDQFEEDVVLGGVYISPEDYKRWTSEVDLCLKLWEPSLTMNSPDEFLDRPPLMYYDRRLRVASPRETRVPVIHMRVCYVDREYNEPLSVCFTSFFTVYGSYDQHTEYNVTVFKGDGSDWTIRLRYSQIYKLRKHLIQEYPHLKSIPFPKKNLLGWLSPRSRFDGKALENRRYKLEFFMNYILKNNFHIRSEQVAKLLIPQSVTLSLLCK
jgi:hypothetical protein